MAAIICEDRVGGQCNGIGSPAGFAVTLRAGCIGVCTAAIIITRPKYCRYLLVEAGCRCLNQVGNLHHSQFVPVFLPVSGPHVLGAVAGFRQEGHSGQASRLRILPATILLSLLAILTDGHTLSWLFQIDPAGWGCHPRRHL